MRKYRKEITKPVKVGNIILEKGDVIDIYPRMKRREATDDNGVVDVGPGGKFDKYEIDNPGAWDPGIEDKDYLGGEGEDLSYQEEPHEVVRDSETSTYKRDFEGRRRPHKRIVHEDDFDSDFDDDFDDDEFVDDDDDLELEPDEDFDDFEDEGDFMESHRPAHRKPVPRKGRRPVKEEEDEDKEDEKEDEKKEDKKDEE